MKFSFAGVDYTREENTSAPSPGRKSDISLGFTRL